VATPRGPVEPPATRPPDVVMVMLDGYPGDAAAKLATTAGSPYDADLFPDELEALGFHVQRNSNSNYLLTPMTLASMFDMRHLSDIEGLVKGDERGGQGRRFRQIINDSAGLEALHRAGYELIWVDSGFNHVETRRVDRWIDQGSPNELEIRMLALTFAGRSLNTAAPDLLSGLQRQRVTAELGEITSLVDEPHDQPRFIFVHIPSPHAPWIFGPDGEPRREGMSSFFADFAGARGIDRDEALRRVFDQATYIGKQTAAQVSKLVDRPNPPAVVVFSDHGPGTEISFTDPATTDLVERSSNFLATFTPGKSGLYDEFTTPVNILSTLLTGYLGADVPRKPDTIYAWSGSELNLFPVDVFGTNAR
jgi:sulfatase-like protein